MITLSKLVAYLSLDKSKYEEGLNEANKDATSLGSKLGKTFGAVSKITGAAITAGAAAVGKIVNDSVSAFGEFQQLEGGIQTLFGKDAQAMLNNASKAFKTAGVSANQYMEMAIQSSAAMITSLGGDTKRASELMDRSIIDMSDNVNKMGTTMEAVQNAYRGFSRGNFTMLDNLALGYAGTKEGMEELIARANEINKAHGVMSNYAIDSYADIVEAIHVVQNEMGITGTTAKEAGDTITGSAGSAKAAWEDLKVAMATGDNVKLTRGVENLIASVTVMAENIIPVVERALQGVGTMIEKIVPIISERLPDLVEQILPGLLSAATSLVQGVLKALPGIVKVIGTQLPKILKTVISSITGILPDLIKAITELQKSLVTELPGIVLDLINTLGTFITENIGMIIDAGMDVTEALVDGIMNNLPMIIEAAFTIIQRLGETIIEKLPEILERGKDILMKIVQGITENLPKLIQAAVDLIKNLAKTLIDHLPEILQAGVNLILELGKGIFEALPDLLTRIPQIITDLIGALLSPEMIGKLLQAGLDMIGNIFDGILSGDFLGTAWDLITGLLGAVLAIPGTIMEIGVKVVNMIWEGMKGAWGAVQTWFEDRFEDIFGNLERAKKELNAELEKQASYREAIEKNSRKYHPEWYADEYASDSSHYSSQYTQEKNKRDAIDSGNSMAARYNTTNIYLGGSKTTQVYSEVEAEKNARGNGG